MDWTEKLFFETVWSHTIEVIQKDEEKNAAFKLASVKAFDTVRRMVLGYVESRILFWLAVRILYKKGKMIERAATKKELDEIVKPSIPRGSCGNFYEGPYHVYEEELILWSKASLEAPLNETGYGRYAKVFSMFFPTEAEEIFGTAVTKDTV